VGVGELAEHHLHRAELVEVERMLRMARQEFRQE
jgi:hypothetical protein